VSVAVYYCHHFTFKVAGQQIRKLGPQLHNKNKQRSVIGQQKYDKIKCYKPVKERKRKYEEINLLSNAESV